MNGDDLMKMKFSLLTAAVILTFLCTPISANALNVLTEAPEGTMVIIGEDKDNDRFVLSDGNGTYYISISELMSYYLVEAGLTPSWYHILQFHDGVQLHITEQDGTDQLTLSSEGEPTALIKSIGFSSDWDAMKTLTVQSVTPHVSATLTDGENTYVYALDWMGGSMKSADDVDWDTIEIGNEVKCIMLYNVPVIAFKTQQKTSFKFVITQMDENHAILREIENKRNGQYAQFDVSDWSAGNEFFTKNFSDFEAGDIITYYGKFEYTDDIDTCLLVNAEGTVKKIGSVKDDPQIADFTESYTDGSWSFVSSKGDAIPVQMNQTSGFSGRIGKYYTYQNIPTLLDSYISYAKGDFNNDGTVDIMDVIAVNRYIVGVRDASPAQQIAVDINQNGDVDANDSLSILKIVLNVTD